MNGKQIKKFTEIRFRALDLFPVDVMWRTSVAFLTGSALVLTRERFEPTPAS